MCPCVFPMVAPQTPRPLASQFLLLTFISVCSRPNGFVLAPLGLPRPLAQCVPMAGPRLRYRGFPCPWIPIVCTTCFHGCLHGVFSRSTPVSAFPRGFLMVPPRHRKYLAFFGRSGWYPLAVAKAVSFCALRGSVKAGLANDGDSHVADVAAKDMADE